MSSAIVRGTTLEPGGTGFRSLTHALFPFGDQAGVLFIACGAAKRAKIVILLINRDDGQTSSFVESVLRRGSISGAGHASPHLDGTTGKNPVHVLDSDQRFRRAADRRRVANSKLGFNL